MDGEEVWENTSGRNLNINSGFGDIMAEEKNQEKKIIIDEDWKNKAQKEKETLKDKAEKKPAGEKQSPQSLPQGDFNALVSLLATQAFFAMGLIAAENDKEPKKDLPLATWR